MQGNILSHLICFIVSSHGRLSKTYSQRKQSDISLDHIFKIKSPLGARDGTVVDWRRTKGRLTIETVEIEEDIMNGGEKVTAIGDYTVILRELVDNDKRGGKQSNSIENKWIKMNRRNGSENMNICSVIILFRLYAF